MSGRRRVVVTGMAGISPLGRDWKRVGEALAQGVSGVVRSDACAEHEGFSTELSAPVSDFETPQHYPRKKTRAMGRVSLLATRATELALEEAGLIGHPALGSARTGVSYGSSTGSPPAMGIYCEKLYTRKTLRGIAGSDYLRFMSHTAAANLAAFFELHGRVIPSCSACTSGSQGIGFAFDAIRDGYQDVMVAGGAEEFDPMNVAVFDILYAASTRNEEPTRTPRPFDADRDGMVVGEGAATLVLESLEHAQQRGARIHAEIVGWATNCDGRHLTNPDPAGMEAVMRTALEDAGVEAAAVDYVNAHGTGTATGDVAESQATHAVYGDGVPVSTFKGHMGHTLGACGALEAWMLLASAAEGWIAPTLNLERVDERCAPLDYVMGAPRRREVRLAASNNFAFGGVNTSLLFRLP